MQSKIKKLLLRVFLPLVFWLAVWQICAILVNRSYFLPGVPETLKALFAILQTKKFLSVCLMTLYRVLCGLLLGTLLGSVFAVLAYKFKFIHALLSPMVSVIKATPIASIIILLWISMNGNSLSILVALLMVFPIIWQNLYDGFSSVNKELTELAAAYEFSFKKKLAVLVLPSLKGYFIPAFITSIGLAWKSEIAAEIIAGVRTSIGQMIYQSKDSYDTASVFAWTLIGIILSITLEKTASLLLKKRKFTTKKERAI